MKVARSSYMHSKVNSVYVPRFEVFSKRFAISESFGREVAGGCRECDGNEAEGVGLEGNAEAKLRRSGQKKKEGGRGGERRWS